MYSIKYNLLIGFVTAISFFIGSYLFSEGDNIVGGIVGGVTVFLGYVFIGPYLRRRKKENHREETK